MSPPKDPHKEAFIVLAPTGKRTTYSIAGRRIGSKQRYTVVATCQSDTLAQRLVDGLTLLHKGELALEVPAQRMAEELRSALTQERTLTGQLRLDIRRVEQEYCTKLAAAQDKIGQLTVQLDALEPNAQKEKVA